MANAPPDTHLQGDAITVLLSELNGGNREIEAQLIAQVYSELRRLAKLHMRAERANHTLQPTALVNEAYARLVQQHQPPWQDRAHFFATASHVMRHILVDYARARQTAKRGGVQHQVTLHDEMLPAQNRTVDVLILEQALEHLTAFDPRQARIVELHFFGGLTFQEIASVLELAERTVEREWSMARAWLKGELSQQV